MRFLSVCSGIEAASVAWNPLGWEAVAFSEIEPFPCAVLAHHYPSVPNWGDMTKFQEWPDADVDLLCGGTPCQSFSVAGLRKGLADPRGNLMLTFGAIAAKYRPRWLVWENVPGVLSSNGGRDFGAFLGMLGQLGYGFAYRVLDAQYFGVPQRRRRVFVVGCIGDWRRAAAVLFERHSMSGDSAPSREARKVAPTIPSRSTGGGGLGTDFDCDGGLQVAGTMKACKDSGGWSNSVDHAAAGYMVPVKTLCVATGQAGAEIGADMAPTLNCNHEAPIAAYGIRVANTSSNGLGIQEEATHTLDRAMGIAVAHALRGEGFDASKDGTGRGTPLVPIAFSCKDHGGDAGPISPTLRSMGNVGSHANAGGQVAIAFNARQDPDHWHDRTGPLDTDGGTQAVAFDTTQITSAVNRSNPKPGDLCHPLAAGAHAPAIALTSLGATHASTQEAYAHPTLRAVRKVVGAKAFAEWGLGILDSLQPSEVLRQTVHGCGLRLPAFSRNWLVCCALGSPLSSSEGAVQSLREAAGEGCASQGWEPSEQLAGELGAYLSELSRPGAQAARLMRDLWFASEGFGLLQQALLAIQEVGRPASRKGQSVLRGSEGRGAEIPEDVSSARMQREAPRERVLHEARAAGEARDYRNGATEQERSGKGWVGEAPLAVRRLVVEECEFLQGFPRGYSKIPWRNKPASECPDGPRYKALGNSWAVPVVRWIGERIQRAIDLD